MLALSFVAIFRQAFHRPLWDQIIKAGY